MTIGWINAAALWGLGLIAIPIAIHLLVRQQTRVVAYPSLRFVRETALAAFRRRAIQDALLLICRIAIVAIAAMALAGPVLYTSSRAEDYASRTARAVIVLDRAAQDAAAAEQRDVFRSATFQRAAIADAVNDGARWLQEQPPSLREMVFVGSLHRGQVEQSDLLAVPADVGLRFVRAAAADTPREVTASSLTRQNGQVVRVDRRVHLSADATRVSTSETVEVGADRLRVVAAEKDQPLADAALRAALDAGVRWPRRDARVVVVWEGAPVPPASDDLQIVRMPVPLPRSTAASATWTALDAAMPREDVDPIPIADDHLTQWSRPPGRPSSSAAPYDEGDRRWLWIVALVLLGVEYLLRRDRQTASEPSEARRVA